MNQRPSLLVGSMPYENEAVCMQQALEYLSSSLVCLPDGEISNKASYASNGKRNDWSATAIEKLSADPSYWQVDAHPRQKVASSLSNTSSQFLASPYHSPHEIVANSAFEFDTYFQTSFPIFLKLRQRYQRPDLSFQVSVPTGFAIGLSMANKHEWLRYTKLFNQAIAHKVNAIYRAAGQDVLFQIKVPTELYAAYLLPSWLICEPLRPIIDLLELIEPGARIGIHLCIGDFHTKALSWTKGIQKMVDFSNWLVASWPIQHQLEYIHFPLAEGDAAPTTDQAFYKPLAEVYLPAHTHFFAGIIHKKQSFEQVKMIMDMIETLRKARIGIASSCGLGCHSPEIADQLLEQTAQLASA
jgi:hypothetical protein